MTAEHRVIGAVRLLVVATVVGVLFIQQATAQSAGFQRGEHVRIKAPTKPSDPVRRDMVLTVVAIPNDRIRFDDSGIYVNDIAVTAFSQDFLLRVAGTSGQTPQIVPDGHYFVMGEARTNGDKNEYWGQHSVTSLESTR